MTSEWSDVSLGEAVDLQPGFAFKSERFLDAGDVRLARGANISQGRFDWSNVKYWPDDDQDVDDRYRLTAGDVLLAMDRPWIEAGLKYTQVSTADLPALLVQRVARLRAREQVLDQGFLYYLLGSPEFTDYVRSVETGTTIPHISGGQIQGYMARIPPVDEQRAIAEVLAALDDRILWCHRDIQLAHDIARCVAERRGTASTVPLAEVAQLMKSTISSSRLDGDHWTHYSIPAFDAGQQPVVEPGADIRSGKFAVPDGAVLVSKLNPTWPRVWLPALDDDPPAICSTELLPIVPHSVSPMNTARLWASLLTADFNRQLRELATGSTGSHQRVRPEDMLTCRVMDPTMLTTAEADLLQHLAARVREVRQQRQSVINAREALLPRLLSGELRVENPSRLAKAVA